jgi:uncharacterized protein YbjT (DUF2867 family)
MIAIFGANGKTGREIIREAIFRGVQIRPIVRNDYDTAHLDDIVHVNELYFADADHPNSIPPALEGCDAVVCCIDARTAGWGAPTYTSEAAVNIVQAAHDAGITKILQLSVMGSYRWSPNMLNRQSFHLDLAVRRTKVPWTMLRISCYHDEIIDAHIRPPDDGRPHIIHPSSRYSPVSRRDVARVILNILPTLIPSRTWLVGGPQVLSGKEMEKIIAPYRKKQPHGRSITGLTRKLLSSENNTITEYGPLPHGDMSVSPHTTEIMIGWVPTETLGWALDPKSNSFADESPFWNREIPQFHSTDAQEESSIFSSMNRDVRFALHRLLSQDYIDMTSDVSQITLGFSQAIIKENAREATPHKSHLSEICNIQIKNVKGQHIFSGNMRFLYDDLADELQIWWQDEEEEQGILIPKRIWERLDLGVRRRLIKDSYYKNDHNVREFSAQNHV